MKTQSAVAVILLSTLAVISACNDGGDIDNPPVAPTIRIPPPTMGSAPAQPQSPPSQPDWDKDSADIH